MVERARRTFLEILSVGIGAVVGAVVAGPAAIFVGWPIRHKTVTGGEEPLPVGRLDRLPEGVPVSVRVNAPERRDAWTRFTDVPLGAVWLVRRGSDVTCLSSTCSHAGCFVDYEAEKRRFLCPCHGSAFDLDGKRVAGPTPRAMDTLETEVKEGKVLVKFRRFRQATPDKEEV